MRGRIYKRKSGSWAIDFVYDHKRYREVIGSSKQMAETVLHKRLAEVAEGKFLGVQKEQKIKFEELVDSYIKLHASQKRSWRSSYRNSIRKLLPYFQDKYVTQITPRMIEEFRVERSKQVSEASVNRDLAYLKGIFNKGIEWGMVQENPARKVKLFREKNHRTRFLSHEELANLLSCCKPRLRSVVIIAVNTGMRKGELQNLKWEDVDFERGIITLTYTKNGEMRHIPMNQAVRDALIALKQDFQSREHVFTKKDGNPYDIRKSFDTALIKANILDFRFHDLRHTFASHLVMSGIDLNTVRELLGHKSLEMTLRYSHLSQSHKIDAVQKLNQKLVTAMTPQAPTQNPQENSIAVTALAKVS